MILIKPLPEDRWKDYRNLRLDALFKDPTAFGSSFEEEKKFTAATWRERMPNARFALKDDLPLGMIVIMRIGKVKLKHIANIYGVYVQQDMRDRGIGSMLVESAVEEISQWDGIVKIDLSVNSAQKPALALYTKFGFEPVGTLSKDLCVDGQYYDEVMMEKFL